MLDIVQHKSISLEDQEGARYFLESVIVCRVMQKKIRQLYANSQYLPSLPEHTDLKLYFCDIGGETTRTRKNFRASD